MNYNPVAATPQCPKALNSKILNNFGSNVGIKAKLKGGYVVVFLCVPLSMDMCVFLRRGRNAFDNVAALEPAGVTNNMDVVSM